MNPLVTALLVAAFVAILALTVVGPIRAVRQDRSHAAEERGWLATGRFPAEVERAYRRPGLILTDAPRLQALGYDVGERRKVRGAWVVSRRSPGGLWAHPRSPPRSVAP